MAGMENGLAIVLKLCQLFQVSAYCADFLTCETLAECFLDEKSFEDTLLKDGGNEYILAPLQNCPLI